MAQRNEGLTREQLLLVSIRDKRCSGNMAELGRRIKKDPSYVARLFYPSTKPGAKGVGLEIMKACNSAFALPLGFWEMTPEEADAALDGNDLIIPSSLPIANDDGSIEIEQFDTGGGMGHGLVLQDQPGVIRRWVVTPDWLRLNVHRITSPRNLAIVTGFGDSMRPLFNPGDPLLIDRGILRPDIDGVFFFRVDDQGYVKRLQRIPTPKGMIIKAKSDNPQYETFEIVKGMDFEVYGRVVKAWRGEDL
jgi:hypothetical protein